LNKLVSHEHSPGAKRAEPGHGKHGSGQGFALLWISDLADLHVVRLREGKRNTGSTGFFHGREKLKVERVARLARGCTGQANPHPEIQVHSGSGVV
jgi:hypothetical protein